MNESTIRNDSRIFIGSNIKRIREKQGLKPSDLIREVQLLGIDINIFSLSKIEANTQHIKASQFRAIAEVLKVDYNELLKREDEL